MSTQMLQQTIAYYFKIQPALKTWLMRRKIFIYVELTLIVAFSLLNLPLTAASINQKTATQKAKAFFGGTRKLKLITKDAGEEPAYYVFNDERGNKGFVIVSGEESDNCILGYSEEGKFDPNNMPPALKYWLQCYSEQTEMIRLGRADAHSNTDVHETIAPLIKTKWDQDEPYNMGNPINPITKEIFKYTGCTATAIAQVLKYWSVPSPTQKIPSYTYYLSADGKNSSHEEKSGYLKITIDELPSTTFNYDIMEDSYIQISTEESEAEIAKLMAYSGRAVKMEYRTDASGGSLNGGFFEYFGFKSKGQYVYRSNYNSKSWDELIYNELSAGRPVLYTGGAQSPKDNNRHAFVCDGYKDGLYHINWGWGGHYDGYFKLSEANPHGTGIGGTSGKNGYSISQTALIRVQPDALKDSSPLKMDVKKMKSSNTHLTRTDASKNFTISVNYAAYNTEVDSHTFDLGLGIYQGDKLINDYINPTYSNYKLEGHYGWNDISQTISWGSGISDGTYILSAISRETGAKQWQKNIKSDAVCLILTVSGNTLDITESFEQLQVNQVNIIGLPRPSKKITLEVDITNIGTTNISQLYLFKDGELNTGVGVNIDPGTTDIVPVNFSLPQAGDVQLELYGGIDSNGYPIGVALWTGSVSVLRAPSLSVDYKMVNAKTTWKGSFLTGNHFKVAFLIKNMDQKPFEDELTFKLYKYGGRKYELSETQTVKVNIPVFETKEVELDFKDLEGGFEYYVAAFLYDGSENDLLLNMTGNYSLSENTGIENVNYNDEKVADIYNLNGQRIKQPAKGIYIIKGRKIIIK